MSNTFIIPVNELRVEFYKLTPLIFGQKSLQITKWMFSILVIIQNLTNMLVRGKISKSKVILWCFLSEIYNIKIIKGDYNAVSAIYIQTDM